jgi:hypothetical protein
MTSTVKWQALGHYPRMLRAANGSCAKDGLAERFPSHRRQLLIRSAISSFEQFNHELPSFQLTVGTTGMPESGM